MKTWQEEYLAELKRTTGRTEKIASKGGGWYSLTYYGHDGYASYRQRDFIAMTSRLKQRPDKMFRYEDG